MGFCPGPGGNMDYKQLTVDAGLRLINSGLTVATWGNISARDPEKDLVYLTPSGMDYSVITPDDIVVCDMDRNVVEGSRKPTIEKDLHIESYRARPDINAIVHTHAVDSTVFACMGEDIPVITDEAAQVLGGPVKRAEYALPGTMDLAYNCVKALGKDSMACLLQSHGAVCLGFDMNEAFRVSKVLEMTALIYYKIRSIGARALPMSEEDIAFMRDFMKNKYGQR